MDWRSLRYCLSLQQPSLLLALGRLLPLLLSQGLGLLVSQCLAGGGRLLQLLLLCLLLLRLPRLLWLLPWLHLQLLAIAHGGLLLRQRCITGAAMPRLHSSKRCPGCRTVLLLLLVGSGLPEGGGCQAALHLPGLATEPAGAGTRAGCQPTGIRALGLCTLAGRGHRKLHTSC